MSAVTRLTRTAEGFSIARSRMGPWLETQREEVSQHQLERLRIVWDDVTANVPFYRDLVTKQQAPKYIECIQQFCSEVPTTTKQQMVERPDLFTRTDRKPDSFIYTGGSTGEPLRIGRFRDELKPAEPDVWLGKLAYGLNGDDRVFLIWGHSYALGGGLRGRLNTAKRHLKDALLGYERASAYDLSPEASASIIRRMNSFSPAMVIGYSSAIDAVARVGANSGLDGRQIGLKFVVATSEALPYRDSARLIEDFFGCPLAMEYGGHDFGYVAHTVPGTGYRVFWHNMLAEIQLTGPDKGMCLVTPLFPRYFPAIRYVTGDEIEGPILGSAGQLVGFCKVTGRTSDNVLLPDGTRLHATAIEDCVQFEPGVHRFQVSLEDQGIVIHLVGDPARTDIPAIRRRLAKVSAELAKAEMVFVEDTIVTPAGKRRWVVDRRKRVS